MRGLDVTGWAFGALTAIEPTAKRSHHSVVWKFRCGCGAEIERALYSVRYSARVGATISCGCLERGQASARALDLTGHRYGKLTVLRCVGADDGLRWACLCECGVENTARGKDLRLGTTTSCGCSTLDRWRAGQLKNSRWAGSGIDPGDRFGLLVVREQAESRNGMRRFVCKCDCGSVANVRANLLRSGQTRSCGCLRKTGAKRAAENRHRSIEAAGASYLDIRATPAERLGLLCLEGPA